MRKEALVSGQVYHIFNKSIAGFKIFINELACERMLNTIRYYQSEKQKLKFSKFIKLSKFQQKKAFYYHLYADGSGKLVTIIAYCIMPTHFHFILKQLTNGGISTFMGNTLNSYSKYFNIRFNRKGPLWEGRFKNVLVKTNEQLLHLTRYVHLNPVSVHLVKKAENWPSSSYREYLWDVDADERICQYEDLLDIGPFRYQSFVEDRAFYQRDLEKIKRLLLE